MVKACEDVRIKDIKKEDAERLIEVVGKWGFYMGASARQSSEDILLICKFLRDNYEMLTINEINLAINLNLRGSLGNNEFFGHLSPLYISQVLNAYNDYKQEVVKPLIQRKERDSYTPTPELTKEENYKMICDAIRYEYAKFKANKGVNDMFSIIYDFMKKSGRLSTNEELIQNNYLFLFQNTIATLEGSSFITNDISCFFNKLFNLGQRSRIHLNTHAPMFVQMY